jgi:putative solute:sodium symporter small subunit
VTVSGEAGHAGKPPPSGPVLPDAAHLAVHWRKTRILTALLLLVWLGFTLGIGVFARALAQIRFFGWPLSYYMGAQGILIVFLLIIGCYALVMNRLDREALAPPAGGPALPPPGPPEGGPR